MRRFLVTLIALLIGLTALVGVSQAPAQAAVDYPTICSDCVTFDPDETRFSKDAEDLTVNVEVDVSADWDFVGGYLYVIDPHNYGHFDDWLKLSAESKVGNKHRLVFKGQIPNEYAGQLTRGYLQVYPYIYYRSNNNQLYASYNNYPWYHRVTGDVRTSLDTPASIPSGSALTLSGRFTCFKRTGFQVSEDGGWVQIEYSLPGANSWQYQGGTSISAVDGTWSFTVPAVGATLDWRATVYPGDYEGCAQGVNDVVTVEAGTGEPPPPPELPDAPGLTIGAVTQHTIALDWSAPSGDGIIAYRFGWDSANGLPQPSYNQLVENPADPYVFTNLCAGCTYTVWVEAVTGNGTGDRAQTTVTTSAEPTPPPSPSVPGKVRALKGKAGNHKAFLSWKAPKKVNGATVTKYCVHQFAKTKDKCVRASKLKVTMRGLKNNATYSFTVQAFAGDVPGPLSRVVRVRPTRG